MNPIQACKKTASELKALLVTHPTNKWLKLWYKRLNGAVVEIKKKGYSLEFLQFWKLYDVRTGSKATAYGVWCQKVDDPEAVMAAVKLYKADCKKNDVTVAHASTWLNETRWDSYDGVGEKIEEKHRCGVCKDNDAICLIDYKMDNKGYRTWVCVNCQKYDGKTYNPETKEWKD